MIELGVSMLKALRWGRNRDEQIDAMAATVAAFDWNACSIRNRTRELHVFLAEKEIDIAVITETHLKPTMNVFLPGYRLVRLDRTDAERGSCCRLSGQHQLPAAAKPAAKTHRGHRSGGGNSINDGSAAALKQDIVKRFFYFVSAGGRQG